MTEYKIKELTNLLVKHQIGLPTQSVLEKCVFLCEILSIGLSELVDQLDAFLTGKGDTLTADLLGKFEAHIRKETAKSASKQQSVHVSQPAIKFNSSTPQRNSANRPSSARTPDSMQGSPADLSQGETQSVEQSSFLTRSNVGQVVVELNSALGKRGAFEMSASKPLGLRCAVTASDEEFENVRVKYRHMYTSLDERARAIDRQMHKLQTSMCSLIGIEESELTPVGIPSQDEVWVCGRICLAAANGKLNKTSILLEGSRRDSGGRRIHLDLTDVSYSIFPGQIVLVRGINSSGQKMVAKRIVSGAMCPHASTAPGKLLDFHHSAYFQRSKPLSVLVAAGPFTTSDNVKYEPLLTLLSKISLEKPDVVILLGPFVDISQPMIASGDIMITDSDSSIEPHAATYHMLFVERIIRDGLAALFANEEDGDIINTNFIMIPSLCDGHHEFVYPQPPFAQNRPIDSYFTDEKDGALNIPFSSDKDPKKRVHLLPNPCMFRVNEVLFGVTTNDILFGLSSDEISQEPIEAHRMTRLTSHMLYQQSFVPQFPPAQWQPDRPDKSFPSELDMRQYRHWSMKVSPDVLIAPSRLTTFVRETNGTLVINPGQMTKNTSGGTYAEIHVHPISEKDLHAAIDNHVESIPHNVPKRTSVTVAKI